MLLELQPEFDDILQPLGNHAIEFCLAASLYHAKKISFASAVHIAGLSFEAFKNRLEEHFNQGYFIADECALEDIETINDDLLKEYDFPTMGNGVRGKYAKQYHAGVKLVMLDEDVAQIFPDAKSVNDALRMLSKVILQHQKTAPEITQVG